MDLNLTVPNFVYIFSTPERAPEYPPHYDFLYPTAH